MVDEDVLFRYRIVSMVLTRIQGGERQRKAVLAVADTPHFFGPVGGTRSVSVRSIYRWLAAYNESGFAGLMNAEQPARDPYAGVVSPKLIDFFRDQKAKDSRASIPELIRRAAHIPHLKDELPCDRTTVYRILDRLGVTVGLRKKGKDQDARRFAYPHRLDMVLCDGKHFRAGATRARRVAYLFLDDAHRLGLHVVVGTSENAELFQRGLFETVSKYGYFGILYLDRGPGFIADDTIAVVANLDGALLIHGKAAYPQGHGKIEKFIQTVLRDVLRCLDRRPDVDPAPRSLELRLQHYLENEYNPRGHESLGGKSPAECFFGDEKPLRFPDDREALKRKFEVHVGRRVSSDNVVSISSVPYDMPRGYDGMKVILRRRLIDGGKIFFLHEGRLIELHPVDLEANARTRRAKASAPENDEVEHPLPPSAADLAFNRDFGPVVSPDDSAPEPDPFRPDSSQEQVP